VARINQGKIALDRRPLQLQAVVATAIETAQPLLQSKGHTLIANLPDADVWVDGDRVRLTQAFGNLLNNAVKFTPPEGALRVDVTSAPGRVAVSVADTGCGIAPEVLPHVFDLFAQASQAVDRSHGGLGVGLALVRRIVAMHGGDVVAASDGAGRGSRFTVTLPRCAAPAATASPAAAPAASSRHGALRILAVDDNEDALETLAMLLETQGHAVHMATHGERALALAREVEPHVVLLDIGLPGMNGYELAGALRTLGLETPPMLVAISGYGREDDRRRAREAGFAHHLVKPADPERLFDIIDGAATELLQNNR
jgi:CheY-like chemotaxis protein